MDYPYFYATIQTKSTEIGIKTGPHLDFNADF